MREVEDHVPNPDLTDQDRDPLGSGWEPPRFDTGVATPARMYDYYLGGKDNFPADREAAEKVLQNMPQVRAFARANRAFLGRAVRHLAEQGTTQFLDIGIGLPGPGGTVEVAHSVRPEARIVGVDNDPIVLAHARARPDSAGPNPAAIVRADLRDPKSILAHPEVRAALDFQRPIAVMLVAVLHFVTDSDDPYGIVRALMEAVPPGSHLVLSHVTGDFDPERLEISAKAYEQSTAKLAVRSAEAITRFFDGLTLLAPGVVLLPRWRPDGEVPQDADSIWMYSGVATRGDVYP